MNAIFKCLILSITALTLLTGGCQQADPVAAGPPGAFSFVVIGDTQTIEPVVTLPATVAVFDRIDQLDPQPAFVVLVGDHVLGARDPDLLTREWDQFDRVTSEISIPIRHVPGNHDVWDETSKRIFTQRYNPTYFSFDHGSSHFIVLSTEEPDEGAGIGPGQLQWLRDDLDAHAGAAHKFVFMHRPLWITDDPSPIENRWMDEIHPLLADHDVEAVYAGHWHTFMNCGATDGVQYYISGGGGPAWFNHLLVTTVDATGPTSRVIAINGNAMRDDVITRDNEETWRDLRSGLRFEGVTLPPDQNDVEMRTAVTNSFDVPVGIDYRWDTTGTGWEMSPRRGVITIAPGDSTEITVTGKFDRAVASPSPKLLSTIILGGEPMMELSTSFQPLIQKRGKAERVTTPPTIDGTVEPGEYADAPTLGDFVDYKGRSLPVHDTRFHVAYDDHTLYIGVIAQEDEVSGIINQEWPRDGEIWRDDYIDVFIDASFDKSTYHQFASNIRGNQYDALGGPERGQWGSVDWNGTWRSAGRIGDGQFTIEFAIPFDALGVAPPRPGDTWGLNVCRCRWLEGKMTGVMERAAWSIPYGTFHRPSNFGEVTFE